MEGQWIRQHDDLAALAHDSEHDWFNVWLETKLNRLSRNILLVSEPQSGQYFFWYMPLILQESDTAMLLPKPNYSRLHCYHQHMASG